MIDWIKLGVSAFVGGVVGSTIGYIAFLRHKLKQKKDLLKNISNQKNQTFIIPKKQIVDGKQIMIGHEINLKEYCGIKEELDLEKIEPDEEYNDFVNRIQK